MKTGRKLFGGSALRLFIHLHVIHLGKVESSNVLHYAQESGRICKESGRQEFRFQNLGVKYGGLQHSSAPASHTTVV